MQQPVQCTRLPNGLTVITKEIHSAPVGTFWVWYRVGGRNEVPGITGISHWVEHMLFKGTPTLKKGEIFRTISRNGGTLNGFTWIDFTAYFETLPIDRFDLAVRIEADRMANSIFDPDEVASERTVILSEREGNENYPTFHLGEEVNAAAFKIHPYGQGVIGAKSDLLAITRDDLYDYYRRWYVPNNAVVVAVGDFETSAALGLISDAFGAIPRGPEPLPVRSVEPPQEGERRVVVRRPGPTRYFEVAYHAPAASDPDIFPLVVLDGILSGAKSLGLFSRNGFGRSSRLYRVLVDSGLCTGASSSFALTKDPYLFSVSASLRPGVELRQVEEVVDAEVQRLMEGDISDEEMAKVLKQVKAQFVYAAEGVTNQAYWLGSLEMVASHTLLDDLAPRVEQVTKDDVRRVAQRYLNRDNRIIGWFEPTVTVPVGIEEMAAPGGTPGPLAVRPCFLTDGQRLEVPPGRQAPGGPRSGVGPASPVLKAERRVLANGITVLGQENRVVPAVVLRGYLPAGDIFDPDDKEGIAAFTAAMLRRGTAQRSFADINELTDSLGASVGVEAHSHTVGVSIRCLREDFPTMLGLLGEILRRPTFPGDEIEKLRGQVLSRLEEQRTDTGTMAEKSFIRLAYPSDHPYHHWRSGEEATVRSFTADDMQSFHRRYYQPGGLVFSIVGDILFDAAVEQIERVFGDWQSTAPIPALDVPDAPAPTGIVREHVPISGKSQVNVTLGRPAIPRSHSDFYALHMADLILGGLGLMGRLGASVRDRQGLAYHVSSDIDAARGPAPWLVRAGVGPANVEQAIQSILEEVQRIREELVDEEELEDGKAYLTGALPLSLETGSGVARILQRIELFNLGLDYLDRYPDIIRSLTREQVRDAAHRWFSTESLVISTAGPS